MSRLTTELKDWLAVNALSCWPAQSFLSGLMEDDRVLHHYEAYKQDLEGEMAWLVGLSPPVWIWLNGLTGAETKTAFQPRHDCIEAARVSVAFITDRVLRVCTQLPFSLLLGDVVENLQKLAAGPSVANSDVASKIQRLLRHGGHEEDIIRALALVRDIHWTTLGAEQSHGSLAVLHRFHRRYGQDVLGMRAFLHACRAMVAPPPRDSVEETLRRRLAKLMRSNPEKLSAKSEFVRIAFEAEIQQKGRQLTNDERKAVIRDHGHHWHALTAEHRERLEFSAVSSRMELRAKKSTETAQLEAHLAMHLERKTSEEGVCGVVQRLSECRIPEEELEAVEAMWESVGESEELLDVRQARAEATTPPVPLPEALKERYQRLKLPPQRPDDVALVPEWGRKMARVRAHMRGVAVRFRCLDRWFLFQYARQDKLTSSFAEMHLVRDHRPQPSGAAATLMRMKLATIRSCGKCRTRTSETSISLRSQDATSALCRKRGALLAVWSYPTCPS